MGNRSSYTNNQKEIDNIPMGLLLGIYDENYWLLSQFNRLD